jgi:hypothetical protein
MRNTGDLNIHAKRNAVELRLVQLRNLAPVSTWVQVHHAARTYRSIWRELGQSARVRRELAQRIMNE